MVLEGKNERLGMGCEGCKGQIFQRGQGYVRNEGQRRGVERRWEVKRGVEKGKMQDGKRGK